MKKITLLLASVLAGALLAGCSTKSAVSDNGKVQTSYVMPADNAGSPFANQSQALSPAVDP